MNQRLMLVSWWPLKGTKMEQQEPGVRRGKAVVALRRAVCEIL